MAKKKKAAQGQPDDQDNLSLEDALSELENITAQLEAGTEGLDESISQFERGMQLLKNCHSKLDAAARRIEIVTRVDADGSVDTKPFEDLSTFDAVSNSDE